MSDPLHSFRETTVLGERTQEWRLMAEKCPALALHGIAHVGICHAAPPFEVVRLELKGAYLLSCYAGSGSVLMDGRWQRVRAGWTFMAPPHVLLAFRAESGTKWGFSWVRYQLPDKAKLVVSPASPALARFAPEPLKHAVLGLFFENKEPQSPRLLSLWAQMIHDYVLLFVRPNPGDRRLERLWEEVAPKLSEAWTLERMAAICFLSEEHLRRLCKKELGRSPVNHLIHLRMQKAAELLALTEDKVEVVATAVGYANAFVFSNTFKRWIGWRPSEYRKKRQPSSGSDQGVEPP
jgi:AraC-like DNA-binding protein